MTETIRRVAVIGAGTMGAGIGAQIANAGLPVLLLDLPAAAGKRNAVAQAAIARMLAADPSPFMHRAAAELVQAGNTDDDFDRLAECDWIVEAIVERLEVKQALYRRIDAVRRPGTAISSNTSTIALARLIEGMPDAFSRDCLITHFFNPPRQMRLLELVSGPHTDPALAARVGAFVDRRLGKTVVVCRDTPGFIANRIGAFWMLTALAEALRLGVAVEAADALLGRPFGVPTTGVFGLMDLIGLDVMVDITESLAAALPTADPLHQPSAMALPWLRRLVAAGRTGRKGGGGFTRLDRMTGERFSIDLGTGEERSAQAPPAFGLTWLDSLHAPPPLGTFAAAVMTRTLAYSAGLVPEAADSPVDVDTAMRLGYNWKQGPFELMDQIGHGTVTERLEAAGLGVPPMLRQGPLPFYRNEGGQRQVRMPDRRYVEIRRAPGAMGLADVGLTKAPLVQTPCGALWDIGEGVACLEAATKMGTFDPGLFDLLHQAVALVAERFRALVLYHEGSHFSAGANLALVLQAARDGDWAEVKALALGGQSAFKALKYAPFPVVAAPFGLALGGGCEIVLNSDAVQAHAELAIGLVECNVGLIPGWGGCGEMLQRLGNPERVFDLVGAATTSTSAAHARELGYLRPIDGITMNRDRLLADARARALALAEGYAPPAPPHFAPADPAALLARLPEQATAHDRIVAGVLARVLCGGGTETALLAAECGEFVSLARLPATQARIAHVLETGKKLRN